MTRRYIVAVVVVLGMLLVPINANTAVAASFFADSMEDLGDVKPGDGKCNAKFDPDPPACTLRAALEEASTLGEATGISLQAGIYQASKDGGIGFSVPIRITGVSEASTIINGSLSAGSFEGSSGFLRMSNVTVQGIPDAPAIFSPVELEHVTVIGGDTGVRLQGFTDSRLSMVTIRDSGSGGGITRDFRGGTSIDNTTVSNTRGAAISLPGPAALIAVSASGNVDGILVTDGQLRGIRVEGNTGLGLSVTNSSVTDAFISGNGSGVVAISSKLSIVTVSDNRTSGPGSVGGIRVSGTSELSGVFIHDNSGEVGGLANRAGTLPVTTFSGEIRNNTGSLVGGVSNESGATLTMQGVTVIDNKSGADAGGILNVGKLTLGTVEVSGNTAVQAGGGIVNRGRDASLTINANTQILLNVANTGAGLFNDLGTADLKDASLTTNIARDSGGAAGILMKGGTLIVNGTTVSGNTGTGIKSLGGSTTLDASPVGDNSGAGIVIAVDPAFSSLASIVSVSNSLIRNNENGGILNGGPRNSLVKVNNTIINGNQKTGTQSLADGPSAGGISNGAGNVLTLTDVTVQGNSGGVGAIANAGTATLTRVTISGNTGTGFQNAATATSTALSAVTISGNQGAGGPGGLQALGPLTVTNATITANTGGGLSSVANGARLKSTLVATNPGGDCQGTPTSLGHNLSSDNTCSTFAASLGDVINKDPLLKPLGGPSGQPQTHALQRGSPAIDAGDNTGCAVTPLDGNGDGTAVCDIGAVEAPALAPPSCTPRSDNVLVTAVANGAGRLRVTVVAGVGTLQAIEFGAATNALVEIPGTTTGTAGNFLFTPPANTAQVTFFVRRSVADSAATVQLIVRDQCGAWPTFVGGGPNAF